MALDDLIARLERDTAARVAAVQARAEGEAAELLAEAARRRDEIVRCELAARRAMRTARLDGELARARQRSRAERLAAERALIDQVLQRARALIDEAGREPNFVRAVARQTIEALRYVEGLAPRVRARPELELALRPVAPALDLDASMPFGAVVSAGDGSVRIDETLAARLERMGPALAVELHKELER